MLLTWTSLPRRRVGRSCAARDALPPRWPSRVTSDDGITWMRRSCIAVGTKTGAVGRDFDDELRGLVATASRSYATADGGRTWRRAGYPVRQDA